MRSHVFKNCKISTQSPEDIYCYHRFEINKFEKLSYIELLKEQWLLDQLPHAHAENDLRMSPTTFAECCSFSKKTKQIHPTLSYRYQLLQVSTNCPS